MYVMEVRYNINGCIPAFDRFHNSIEILII